MRLLEIEKAIINVDKMNMPISNGIRIQNMPGYYSIWVSNVEHIPSPFKEELIKRKTTLLYIGIASNTLQKRLFEQELQHKSAATFFRSIGAVLGYRPQAGSLVGKRNQNNYKFSQSDTISIINWINVNLEICFHYCSALDDTSEKYLIAKYRPLLNWTHNPEPFYSLKKVKEQCRNTARMIM